jgi:HD superfamily phosphodiesterase
MISETSSIPTQSQAEAFLAEAEQLNPGNWVTHSRYVAQAMQTLAKAMRSLDPQHASLDPQRAFILGLLHDIGRREGVHGMRHVLDGFRFLEAEGFPAAGRASLTHSYPDKTLVMGASGWDGTPAELKWVKKRVLKKGDS